jgi:predicted house-cleaning noncanonical NTP pyrophosphatase (MazG superfamily)
LFVSAIFNVIPRMAAISVLLVLITYIFGVMFTILFGDLYFSGVTESNYFGTLELSIFTLFQFMTLDNWADVVRDIMTVYKWAWIPILIYVIVTAFIVVNLIIAVICDAIAALHEEEEEKKMLEERRKLREDMGEFSSEEEEDELQDQLDTLELHIAGLKQKQEDIVSSLQMLTSRLQDNRSTIQNAM